MVCYLLNQTNSPNVVRLGIRRYELANNLDSFLKAGYFRYINPEILEKLYKANSKLIEELVFLYLFRGVINYVAYYSKDPIVKAKIKLLGTN